MNKIGNFIGKYIVYVVAVILLTLMSMWTWNAVASSHWPHVMGVVTKSNVDSKSGSGGDLSFSPSVTYEYTLNGREYTASRISYIPIGGRKPSVEYIRRYPKNKRVTVYYNPGNPQRAVLEPGFIFRRIMGFMLFFFSICMAIIVAVAVLRKKGRLKEHDDGNQEVAG